MKLYEEILLLQGYFDGKYCIENVISWYEPLIKPTEMGGHYFWTNFPLPSAFKNGNRSHEATVGELQERKGFDLSKYKLSNKRQILRNCVTPKIGKYILLTLYGSRKANEIYNKGG